MSDSVTVTTPSDREIRVERYFNAPPQLVFDYHTKCEYVQQWLLGPPGWSMPECEMDPRAGGRYRYLWRNDESGAQFGANGEFLGVAAPSRLVSVEQMDGMPGRAHVTTTFEPKGDGTVFSITIEFESK